MVAALMEELSEKQVYGTPVLIVSCRFRKCLGAICGDRCNVLRNVVLSDCSPCMLVNSIVKLRSLC